MEDELKLFFDLLVDPLGLSLPWIYEYLTMFVVGEISYIIAYNVVGRYIRKEYMERNKRSFMHWLVRLAVYVSIWILLRASVWIYGFVVENKSAAIISVICIVTLVITVQLFKSIEEKKRLELVKVRIEERREDVSDESDC